MKAKGVISDEERAVVENIIATLENVRLVRRGRLSADGKRIYRESQGHILMPIDEKIPLRLASDALSILQRVEFLSQALGFTFSHVMSSFDITHSYLYYIQEAARKGGRIGKRVAWRLHYMRAEINRLVAAHNERVYQDTSGLKIESKQDGSELTSEQSSIVNILNMINNQIGDMRKEIKALLE